MARALDEKLSARFAAFFKEKWADGAGELGRHVRREGGENAPWLKVKAALYLCTNFV